MPPASRPHAGRSGAGPSRTYGSKPSAAHRLLRTAIHAQWHDDSRASTHADPLHLHRARPAIVTLAEDSSSSASASPPRVPSPSPPPPAAAASKAAKTLVVQETPSPTEERVGFLSLSSDEEDDAIDVDAELHAFRPPPQPRSTPPRTRRSSRSAQPAPAQPRPPPSTDTEESEIESPHVPRTRSSSRPVGRPLLEVLIPQTHAANTRQRLRASSTPPAKSPPPARITRSQSPLLTANGARATHALAEVIRRSKRPAPASVSRARAEAEPPRRTSRPSSEQQQEPSKRPRRAASPTPTRTRHTPLNTPASRASSETSEDTPQREHQPPARASLAALSETKRAPICVPRKSNTVVHIEPPLWKNTPERSYRPPLGRLPDANETPRPGDPLQRVRRSMGKMLSSDPDSLRGAYGSSPLKRRRGQPHTRRNHAFDHAHDDDDDDDSSEQSDGSEEKQEGDDDDTVVVPARGAAAMQMSQKEHSIILGPDPDAVDENMRTLLSVCGQRTFIPFSRILSLLGAAPAARTGARKKHKKNGARRPAAGVPDSLVKIGEATYSEVFRLTTQLSHRAGPGSAGVDGETGMWEERKVLKIVPIRKDRPEHPELKPKKLPTPTTVRPSSAAAAGTDENTSDRRRGGRARQPSQKRTQAEHTTHESQQARQAAAAAAAARRKRHRERVSTGPELSMVRDVQREIEVTRALSQLNSDGVAGGAFGSFVKLHAAHIVAGPYPKRLLEAWDEYDETKEGGSENWRPDTLGDRQIFAVIVLGDGGRNLEHSELQTWQQAASIFWQLVHAMATAETAIQFEHRDLHWGNVLISPRPPEIEPLRSATLSTRNGLTKPSRTPSDEDERGGTSPPHTAAPSLLSATTTVNFLSRSAERGRGHGHGHGHGRQQPAVSLMLPAAGLQLPTGLPAIGLGSISGTSGPGVYFSSDFARALEAQNAQVYATIIDFALSRVTLEPGEGIQREEEEEEEEGDDDEGGVAKPRRKRILAYDFEDEEIFEGKGDPQFDVYRDMRELVEGDWETFRPITNVMWLSFFVEKLTQTHKLPRLTLDPTQTYTGPAHRERYFYSFLRQAERRIHESVEDVLERAFDVRDARAKAARTGRAMEEFLPPPKEKEKEKGEGGKRAPKPLGSAKAVLRWMRRQVERLEDGFHAGDV